MANRNSEKLRVTDLNLSSVINRRLASGIKIDMEPTVSADLRPLQNIGGGNMTHRDTVKWKERGTESEAEKE